MLHKYAAYSTPYTDRVQWHSWYSLEKMFKYNQLRHSFFFNFLFFIFAPPTTCNLLVVWCGWQHLLPAKGTYFFDLLYIYICLFITIYMYIRKCVRACVCEREMFVLMSLCAVEFGISRETWSLVKTIKSWTRNFVFPCQEQASAPTSKHNMTQEWWRFTIIQKKTTEHKQQRQWKRQNFFIKAEWGTMDILMTLHESHSIIFFLYQSSEPDISLENGVSEP